MEVDTETPKLKEIGELSQGCFQGRWEHPKLLKKGGGFLIIVYSTDVEAFIIFIIIYY